LAIGAGLTVLAIDETAGQSGHAGHVVLLGDSIFDNRGYVTGGPDVVAHLRNRLPAGWQGSLAAMNGAVASDVVRQLERVPREASHLVISAGGNDALRQEAILGHEARSVGEGLLRLATVVDRFRRDYRAMLDAVLARRLPTAVCTVYDPRFADPQRQRSAVAGLSLFNDAIMREAFRRGLPVIDLRLVCDEDADFANAIEPSVQGGRKIAGAIVRLVSDRPQGRAVIYGRD
jgi:lysophospholipase L1-like esterase